MKEPNTVHPGSGQLIKDERCFGCWDLFRKGETLSEDGYCRHCVDEQAIQDSIDRTEAYYMDCFCGADAYNQRTKVGPRMTHALNCGMYSREN